MNKEGKKFAWGLELPISARIGAAQAGATPTIYSETSKEVEHAFTITGTARGAPQRTSTV